MKQKISKRAMYVIMGGILVVLVIVLMVIGNIDFGKDTKKQESKTDTIESIITENQVLKVQLLDFVSEKTYLDTYQEVSVSIEKEEEIAGVTMDKEQVFTKLLQLLPPDNTSPLLNHTSAKASHNAYILVLVGDVAKYQDEDGNTLYRAINCRIEYYKQALLLETQYNSVNIVSIDGKKEKLVKLPDYKEALNDVTKYMTMLQW